MTWELRQGNVLDELRKLPDESVHTAITSPPYWGLRDYGLAPQVWGGDPACEHEWIEHLQPAANGIVHAGGMSGETLSGSSATRKPKVTQFCHCGAWFGSFGLEPTVDLYVAHLVEIFREVRRVLRKDATLWLNLGDCYASNPSKGASGNGKESSYLGDREATTQTRRPLTGLKPKDLVGVPWRAALALQADGWYLRRDIIWHKPTPMPESVQDRPTTAHEYIFLLSKSERYFYDAAAIAEPTSGNAHARGNGVNPKAMHVPNGWNTDLGSHRSLIGGYQRKGRIKQNESFSGAVAELIPVRNARSVWTITSEPFPEAHFATFPRAIPQRCILAGTSACGVCSECGAPWKRVSEKSGHRNGREASHVPGKPTKTDSTGWRPVLTHTDQWQPTCQHADVDVKPAVVLDPFAGSGTTLLVAEEIGRDSIGIELNPEYVAMAERRLRGARTPLAGLVV